MNAVGRDGGTALHAAAFLGHEKAVDVLLRHGAKVNAANRSGSTPLDVATLDDGTTRYFASVLQLELNEDGLGRRKAAIAESLRTRRDGGAEVGRRGPADADAPLQPSVVPLVPLVARPRICRPLRAGIATPIDPPARVAGPLARPLPLADPPDDDPPVVHGGRRHFPDLRAGYLDRAPADPARVCVLRDLLRLRGALFRVRRPVRSRRRAMVAPALGRAPRHPAAGSGPHGGWTGPAGYGLAPLPRRVLSVALLAAYPWLITFGLMGLFRRVCPVESPRMQYLSDSAYWLYLAHLPLIIAAQLAVKDWPIPALAKFLLIVAVVTSFLLWTYQTLVRYTWLGRFLNGPPCGPSGMPKLLARDARDLDLLQAHRVDLSMLCGRHPPPRPRGAACRTRIRLGSNSRPHSGPPGCRSNAPEG